MVYQLTFDALHLYNSGDSGITVPIVLRVGQSIARNSAKIDTGSSHCIFARYLAEELGLNVESGYRLSIGTATGSFIAYGHTVTLTVLGIEFDAMIYFTETETFNRNVLGRQGWLDRVRLGVVDYSGQLYVSRNDS